MVVSSLTVFFLMLLGLIAGIFSGYYLFAVLGGLGVIFGYVFWGPDVFNLVFLNFFGTVKNYTLLAIPLFVFMGNMLQHSGVANKLFDVLGVALGGLKGGLAVSALFISILFAATTGIVGASVVTMGLLFLPAMVKQNYDKSMASGVICAGGTLGILIPPSIMLVVYGPTAGLSVGKLFYGAMVPGIVLGVLYIVYVLIKCQLNPAAGPPLPIEERNRYSTKEKLMGILIHIVPVLALIFAVLGVIWFGIAPPTEAAAIGALASMLIAAAYGKLNLKVLKETLYRSLQTSCMIYTIIIFAGLFVSVFMRLGGGNVVQNAFLSLPFGKWGIFFLMMFMVFILGLLMDWIASMLIIVPIFTPIAASLGFDPLWFAIAVCVMYQTSFLTPPFAYSIFYLKGVAPPGVTTGHIMRGVWPFVVLQIITLLLVILFPQLVLWLPSLMIQ
ncbi:MAG: C4-dicarboxylate ABC transporter [Peptococcaceae bacterium BRH_c8a]|nr:MAG: C4-dicarboxylate ABC transporter [Peptococcaceae bacterium BRH_c8a]